MRGISYLSFVSLGQCGSLYKAGDRVGGGDRGSPSCRFAGPDCILFSFPKPRVFPMRANHFCHDEDAHEKPHFSRSSESLFSETVARVSSSCSASGHGQKYHAARLCSVYIGIGCLFLFLLFGWEVFLFR